MLTTGCISITMLMQPDVLMLVKRYRQEIKKLECLTKRDVALDKTHVSDRVADTKNPGGF